MNPHKELICHVMLCKSEEALIQVLKMKGNGNITEPDILADYMRVYISCREAIDWLRVLPD